MRGEVECDGGPAYDWRRCGACHRRGALVRHFMIGIAPVLLVGHVLAVRRTRSGDAWEARQGSTPSPGVLLGLPTVGVPAPLAPVTGCG